jgi:hypothetical protein
LTYSDLWGAAVAAERRPVFDGCTALIAGMLQTSLGLCFAVGSDGARTFSQQLLNIIEQLL